MHSSNLSSKKPREALAVISSREIGSMDRKSRGRGGRRRPIWEVQCKQSRFLIIPAHVQNWTHFDVLPERPLRPPIPCSQTAVLRASRGKRADRVLGQSRTQGETRGHSVPCGTLEETWKNVKLCRVNWSSVNCLTCCNYSVIRELSKVNSTFQGTNTQKYSTRRRKEMPVGR